MSVRKKCVRRGKKEPIHVKTKRPEKPSKKQQEEDAHKNNKKFSPKPISDGVELRSEFSHTLFRSPPDHEAEIISLRSVHIQISNGSSRKARRSSQEVFPRLKVNLVRRVFFLIFCNNHKKLFPKCRKLLRMHVHHQTISWNRI